MRRQSFVSFQREPVHHENRADGTGLGEEMVQHKSDSGQEQEDNLVSSSARPVQKYKPSMSYNQHPFVRLLTEHTPKNTVEGISFPTVKYFRHFIEAMKSSFLTPGSDLSRHFQTARDVMKSELTSGAENGESSAKSDQVTEESAQHDSSKNEVWREPSNAVFEQNEPDANQQPGERPSVPDPVDATAKLISSTVYDNQGYDPVSALYPRRNSAATQHVSSNYRSLADGRLSGENPDLFISAPHVQYEVDQSSSYKLPEQAASGGDFSHSSQVTASPVKRPNIPSHTSDVNIQQPTYSSHSGVSSTGYHEPSGGFELGKDQGAELYRVGQADVLSAREPQILNSYGKGFYVRAPRIQLYIPDSPPKHRERLAQSGQMYRVTAGKETKGIKNTPSIHLPATTGSTGAHVGAEQSSPHDPQQPVLSEKQPVRSNQVFTVKPSSYPHDSNINDGYFRNHHLSASRLSSLTRHAKHEETPGLSKKSQVSSIQEPQQNNDNSPLSTSSSFDFTHRVNSSPVSSVYGSPDSPTNLAQTSKPKNTFTKLSGNGVMSRNFEISSVVSDRFPSISPHGVKNPLGSFSTQQRQGISPNDIFVSATRAGRLHNFVQPTKANTEPSTMVYQPLKPPAAKVPGFTLGSVFWRNDSNTKRLPPQRRSNMSPQFVNTYVMKSRSSYVRGKISQSKTSYIPYWHVEGSTAKDQWKSAPGKHEASLPHTV